MSCNCKASKDIVALKRNYGANSNKNSKLRLNILDILTKSILFIILFVAFPIMFIYVIYNGMIRKRTLSLKLVHNERK